MADPVTVLISCGGTALTFSAALYGWWIRPLAARVKEARDEAREERRALEERVRTLETGAAAGGVGIAALREDMASLTEAIKDLPEALGRRIYRTIRSHERRCRAYRETGEGTRVPVQDRED